MRGKQPKERKRYVLRMRDGTLVEVSRAVYLEWYQSKRRERYQQERDRKYGVISLEEWNEQNGFSEPIGNVEKGLEELVLQKMCMDKLRESLENLSVQDARLIYFLYLEEVTIQKAAQMFGCSSKAIQNRRKRILKELYQMMQEYSSYL